MRFLVARRPVRTAAALLTFYAGTLPHAAHAQTAVADAHAAPSHASTPAPSDTAAAVTSAVAQPSRAGADTAPRAARGTLPHWLALNGYLTQAAGASRGGLAAGLPSGGTADYRRAALLARISPTLSDRVVVQGAHRRVGRSPMAEYQREFKLDWLFYEHAFGDATRARVGRIPLPVGIYNETRYVGTLLPFYQAPASVYREKEYSSEAIDGGLISHEFASSSAFALEAQLYGGVFNYVEFSPMPAVPALPPGIDAATAQAALTAWVAAGSPPGVLPPGLEPGGWTYNSARVHARDIVGTTLWLSTPVPGLRVGAGALQAHLHGGLRPGDGATGMHVAYASVDGSFDRVTARSEIFVVNMTATRIRGGYAQLGARVAGPLSLNVQSDYSHFWVNYVPLPPTYSVRPFGFVQNRDHAASAIWAFRPTLQARVEAHVTRGYNAEEALDLTAAPRHGRYGVLSLSAAF